MPITVLGGTKVADTAYEVANSCRFNDADSAYLHITPSAGNRDRFTFSCWVKRGVLGAANALFTVLSGSNYSEMYFGSSSQIYWDEYPGSLVGRLVTNRKFRDVSAWYHLVFVYDSANATAGNRMRLYVNGVEETSFATDTQPSSGQDSFFNANLAHFVGGHTGGNEWVDGYMAEVCFIEGSALTPTSFGEFDEDSPTIWKPKDVSGLTFGTNGFYLDFEDSANLGNDANGGTDLTEVNLAATDQTTDTPTNNFCAINSTFLALSNTPVLSQGNTHMVHNHASWKTCVGTIALSSGKWYFEGKGGNSSGHTYFGFGSVEFFGDGGASYGVNGEATKDVSQPSYASYGSNGNLFYSTTAAVGQEQEWQQDWDNNDIVGVYLDLDNNLIYIAKNDTLANSGAGYAVASGYFYVPLVGQYNGGTGGASVNFGNGDFNGTAVSSAVADANGYGAFEYDPSRGGASDFDSAAKNFLAICTKNLGSDGG